MDRAPLTVDLPHVGRAQWWALADEPGWHWYVDDEQAAHRVEVPGTRPEVIPDGPAPEQEALL